MESATSPYDCLKVAALPIMPCINTVHNLRKRSLDTADVGMVPEGGPRKPEKGRGRRFFCAAWVGRAGNSELRSSLIG